MNHWIIAPILIPALTAAVLLLARRSRPVFRRGLSILSGAGQLALALWLIASTSPLAPEAYHLGNWPAPFGIALMLDPLSALMLVLTAGLGLVVLIHMIATGLDRRGQMLLPLVQFQLAGLNGAFLTADAFNLFVFFELLLIASYGLLIHGGGAGRLRAGVQYVVVNLFGSVLFLFALATVYGVTGTLNMADLSVRIAALPPGDHALIRVAAVAMLAVFAIKGAMVPFQFWLPVAYPQAPAAVAALFAVMTKVGAYAWLRGATLIFPPQAQAIGDLAGWLALPGGLLTLAVGAVGVLGSRQPARQAAFAAMASMGTVFAALAMGTPQGITAGLYYMIHSTLAAAALFLIADLMPRDRETGRGATDGAAPGAAAPGGGVVAVLFLAASLAMAGLPPLSGFVGKLMVLQSLPLSGWAVVLCATFAMVLGFARMGSARFWARPEGARPPGAALIAPAILTGGLLALTLWAGAVTNWLIPVSAALHAPGAYIAANRLEDGP